MAPTSTSKIGSDQLARTPPAVPARAVSEEIHSSSITKDSEFWVEDGTIVLVSQNVGFRVYKQELAKRSPLFSDLLSIPQPARAGSEETSDCPVVSLIDPPDQLRHLFRALFSSGGHVTFDKQDGSVTMEVVAAIVRLSHKYQIESLLAEGLSILTEFYTANFEDWIKTDRPTRLQAAALDAITAIDLGHLTNTPSILPLAYLYASDAGFLAPRDGRVDAVLARALLDRGDYTRIASGRAAFIKASSQALVRIVRPVTNCGDYEICGYNISVPASRLDVLFDRLYSQPCQLHTWADEFKESEQDPEDYEDEESYGGWSVCRYCRDMIIARELRERQRIWEMLPSMFSVHVDGWSAKK